MAITYSTPLETVLIDFSRYLYAVRGSNTQTVDNQLGSIKRAAAQMGVNPTEEQIHRYIADMSQRDCSYSHLSNTCVTLEHYTDFLGRPIKLGRPRKPQRLVKGALSEKEVAALIGAAKDLREKTMIVLLAYSGIRNKELCTLQISDLDFDRNTINVRGTKTVRDRVIPLADPCVKVLKEYLEERGGRYDDFVFITKRHGEYYEPQCLRKMIRACAERAGIKKRVYPHLMRHSLATNLMHSGTGILAIKQQMGHVHLGTTMRYLHGDPERLKQEFFVHLPKYLPD